ncbi:MAG: class I SAM-dependent methyltransferase [Candidatus Acidiferrales bacterium]
MVRKFTLPHTVAWECQTQNCGLRFADPQLSDQELTHAYSTHYFPATTDNRSTNYPDTPLEVIQQLFSQLEDSVGNLRGLRMLDYGCGRGPVSGVALEFGITPAAIEPDPVARNAAAERLRIPVYANLEGLRSNLGSAPPFDLIILWQVIEHLRQPWQDLQALRGLLHPQGKLLIATMNANCLRSRIERSRWTHYQNPTHFYYFARSSLQRILTSSGFSRVAEWKPKFRYPHHGVIRHCLFEASSMFGVADGLHYLCSI